MKLTVLGGAGVRSPLLVASVLKHAQSIHLEELALMDTNREKLWLLGALGEHIARRMGSPVRITRSTEPEAALDGARYIITTLRVGEEAGRIQDERIALAMGVLGQETTGPGGFAMAMRSIPAILRYADMAERLAPGAWIFNFTNPAGLVTQALRARGFSRSVGICDSANLAQAEASRHLNISAGELKHEVFGLNHLSWTRRLLHRGEDLLPSLLSDREFLSGTIQRFFDPELVQALGMWLNEYLYYYYYPEKALSSIQADPMTRGEEVSALNQKLLKELSQINPEQNPEAALRVYAAYEKRRSSTYMHYAQPSSPDMQEADEQEERELELDLEEGEGYAGVALQIIGAFESGNAAYTALNVPNEGAIDCMRPDDVVEVSCVIENGAIRPLPTGAVPEHQELLMRSVKRYERLAVESILERSRQKAVMALMAHPLVSSYSLAQALVSAYITAHAGYIEDWS